MAGFGEMMALDIEDYAPQLKAKAAERQKERTFQLGSQERKGQQMRELVVDERWESYTNDIESLVNLANRSIEAAKMVLEGPKFLTAEQYGQARLDLERFKARKEAYSFVVKLIQALINQGEKAAEELMREKLST